MGVCMCAHTGDDSLLEMGFSQPAFLYLKNLDFFFFFNIKSLTPLLFCSYTFTISIICLKLDIARFLELILLALVWQSVSVSLIFL